MKKLLRSVCFSKTLLEKNHSHKVAHIALVTALSVVINALEIKLGGVQFSLTILTAVFAGFYLGAISGFAACFLGDLFGFLLHPLGEYSPWIGISTGLMALFVGLFVLLPNAKKYLPIYVALSCVCIFVFCTCGITTAYLNLVWYKSMSFWECLSMRLFVQGQVFNSLANSILAVVLLPLTLKIKPLNIKL